VSSDRGRQGARHPTASWRRTSASPALEHLDQQVSDPVDPNPRDGTKARLDRRLPPISVAVTRRERRQFAAAFDALMQDAIPSMQRARMLTTRREHLDNGSPGIPAVAA